MDLKEIGGVGVDWIHLVGQDRDLRKALANMVMKIWVA
jgi:hypothetical protein